MYKHLNSFEREKQCHSHSFTIAIERYNFAHNTKNKQDR